MKTYVVINRHIVKANRKCLPEDRDPPIRVSRGKHGKPKYYDTFVIDDHTTLMYRPDEPMPCGATVYLEID